MLSYYDSFDSQSSVSEDENSLFLASYCSHFLESKALRFSNWQKFTCTVCNNLELNGQLEWDEHKKTRKHKKRQRSIAKQTAAGGNSRQYYTSLNAQKGTVLEQAVKNKAPKANEDENFSAIFNCDFD